MVPRMHNSTHLALVAGLGIGNSFSSIGLRNKISRSVDASCLFVMLAIIYHDFRLPRHPPSLWLSASLLAKLLDRPLSSSLGAHL